MIFYIFPLYFLCNKNKKVVLYLCSQQVREDKLSLGKSFCFCLEFQGEKPFSRKNKINGCSNSQAVLWMTSLFIRCTS